MKNFPKNNSSRKNYKQNKKNSNLNFLSKISDSFKNKIILDLEFFSFYKSITDSYGSKLISMLGEPRNPFAKLHPGDALDVVSDFYNEVFLTRYNSFNFCLTIYFFNQLFFQF